jgi:hypothetical protein
MDNSEFLGGQSSPTNPIDFLMKQMANWVCPIDFLMKQIARRPSLSPGSGFYGSELPCNCGCLLRSSWAMTWRLDSHRSQSRFSFEVIDVRRARLGVRRPAHPSRGRLPGDSVSATSPESGRSAGNRPD